MKKFISLLILPFIIFSCSSHSKKNAADKPGVNKADIPICFRYIVENRLKEFRAKIEECKVFRNQAGMTSLMMAIAKENIDFVEALIEAHADVNVTDANGMSALIYAANKNNARIAQLLRRGGARIEIVNNNLSGLMLAVRNSSLELIEILNPTLEELNLKAEDGWSAVYFAINRADPEVLTYLLDRGACTQSKDSYRQRPIDFAREVKWIEGVKILKRKTKC